MKRKRLNESGDTKDNSIIKKKRKLDTIFIGAKKVSLLNLHILYKFIGPFCLNVEDAVAVREEDCMTCTNKLKGEYPLQIWETVQKTGVESYIIDALVRDLFHRGGGKDVSSTSDDSSAQFCFNGINHIPWFASHIILFRCHSLHMNLNLRHSRLLLNWYSEENYKTKQEEENTLMREWSGDVIESMQKAWLKRSLNHFCKNK